MRRKTINIEKDSFHVSLPKEILDKLRDDAEQSERTINSQISWILKEKYSTNNKTLHLEVLEKKQNEEILFRTKSELKIILKSFGDIFLRLDGNGIVLDYITENKSSLYVSPEKFLGLPIYDAISQELSQKIKEAIDKIKENKSEINLEYSLIIKDEEKFFESKILPFSDNQIAICIRDVTKYKRELKKLNYIKETTDG